MNILQRNVVLPRRSTPSIAVVIVSIGVIALSAGLTIGLHKGYGYGLRDGAIVGQGFVPTEETAETDCGITDPLACVLSIVEPIADVFRPLPEMTVVVTGTHIVVCKHLELAYDACLVDESCHIAALGHLAHTLMDCTPSDTLR